MASPPSPDRSRLSSTASPTSNRHPPHPSAAAQARQATYSSLNEALGDRQVQQSYSSQFPAPPSSASQMSSDGRYMYQQQPQGVQSYDYASYAHTSYDAQQQQFPQNPPRASRATSAQSTHSPPEPAYNPSPSSYHPTYGSGNYPVAAQQQQQQQQQPQPPQQQQQPQPSQWNGDNWTHYGQPLVPAPVADGPSVSGPGRPEAAPAPSSQRGYPAAQPNSDPHRPAAIPKAAEVPPQPKRKPRDREPAMRLTTPPTPASGLDFVKLIDSYRVIIDTTTALSNDPALSQGRPPPVDALQLMAESALHGQQILGAVGSSTASPPSEEPTPVPPGGDEGEGTKSEGPLTEAQTCLGCNATSTPEWRRGPLGPRTLCNACGLVYAKLIKKRKREAARRGAKGNGASTEDLGPSSGEEDEDSYEFRTEADDHGGRA
ncbi:hypothetical protein FA95DRAFT_1490384 [Auriscalpium vulgare]|uniref:Uncharacterized protein n=1 Tax=Auriscalpium vulgare TaxID=40419 RepID=A0ACB8RYW0_9AGAM|nr:hypothetical protein FA95DRAFT_1490384 [Auriscalpium vulgare]